MSLYLDIANAIRNARRNAGLTQDELACRVGVTVAVVSRWENCKSFPTLSNLVRIGEATGVDARMLLPG